MDRSLTELTDRTMLLFSLWLMPVTIWTIFVGEDFFLYCMYPLILSFEPINKIKLLFECGFPRPQDVGHLRFRLF
jgi:hypothetical protein